jgi:carbon-monoxide dehydrogenase small subunit
MSAYELLRDGADGLDDERRLREELSGVLCRCTGYAGIVQAVRDVARAHPHGVPPPKALGRPITVLRSVPPVDEAQALAVLSAREPAAVSAAGVDLTIPEGQPNETVDVTTMISAPPHDTWELLRDFARMGRCMPGVELGADEGEDTYSGHVRVNLGPMRLSFDGAARVIERDDERRVLRAIAAGRDASGSGVRADLSVSAEPTNAGGSAVRARARLYLSGRAAQFGRSLAGDVSRQLFADFGECVERTLTTGEAAQPRQLAGGALAWRLARARMQQLIRRLSPRRK